MSMPLVPNRYFLFAGSVRHYRREGEPATAVSLPSALPVGADLELIAAGAAGYVSVRNRRGRLALNNAGTL